MKKIIYIIVLLSMYCCKNIETSLTIDLNRNDKVSIYDLVDSISIIKLETKPECMISFIQQIIPYKNRFYIFDKRLQTVFCFDNVGRFLFKINKWGRGPDEYENCEFINIDKIRDQIMMLVPWGYILYFDLDGNFISKVRLPEEVIAYNEVYSISKDILLFLSVNEYRGAYYSRSANKILKRFLKCSPELVTIMLPINKTYSYNDSIYFNDNLQNNTVINLSDTSNPVMYSWNYGENNNTNEQLMEFYSYRTEQQRQQSTVNLEGIIKNKKYMKQYPCYSFESIKYKGMSLRYEGSVKYVFYNKDSKEYNVFNKTIEGVKLTMLLTYTNSIIDFFSNSKDTVLNKILSENQKRVLESHNSDSDNPFLVIYHIK